jgi:hypothetical protein
VNAPAHFPTQQIRNRLLLWKPCIERALRDADLMVYEDIEKGVLENCYLYFDIDKAFAIVDVQDYTKGRVCHVLAAGGSLAGLRELQDMMIPFFKAIGARRLTQAGRLGWARKLPAWGWKQSLVFMELPIDGTS